jgi:hypothetical protein
LAVHHVDPDVVILGLLARDEGPDVSTGWLPKVEAALDLALSQHERISTEATGAWDTDWQLIGDLRSRNVIVRTVWIHAPFDVTLTRLGSRAGSKVPTTAEEAAWAFTEATEKALDATFDLVLDSSGGLDEAEVIARTRPLLSM